MMDDNRNLHRTVLGYVNQIFQQISGTNLLRSDYLCQPWDERFPCAAAGCA
jgi:hypothetical protein